MTRIVGPAMCLMVLILTVESAAGRQRAAQLRDDEIYIVNTTISLVQFSLRPPKGTWTDKVLKAGESDVYGGSEKIEFRITTDRSDGPKKTVNYILNGGNRYAIYLNGDFYDLREIGIGDFVALAHRHK